MPITAASATADAVEHFLDFARVDVVPTADDQILLPIDDGVVPVTVARAMSPVRNHPSGIACCVRAVPVPSSDSRPEWRSRQVRHRERLRRHHRRSVARNPVRVFRWCRLCAGARWLACDRCRLGESIPFVELPRSRTSARNALRISTGMGAPPVIHVRSEDMSVPSASGSASSRYMVGTPSRTVTDRGHHLQGLRRVEALPRVRRAAL